MVRRRHQSWYQVLKGVRILWRKLLFFSGIFGAIILTSYFLGYNPFPKTAWFEKPSQQTPLARQTLPTEQQPAATAAIAPPKPTTVSAETGWEVEASLKDNLNMSGVTNLYRLEITILPDGRVQIGDKIVEEKVEPKATYDEFRYVVLDKQPEAAGFYDSAQIVLHLPRPVPQAKRIKPRTIGVHGVAETAAFYADPQTIVFQAKGIMPTATLTILARFPKGIVEVSAFQQVEAKVISWPARLWLVIGGILPILGLIVFVHLLLKQRYENWVPKPKEIISRPPSNLPPALVGLLFYGRIRPRDIVASLLHLASRGLIEIHENQGQMVIFKRRIQNKALWQSLSPFEQLLLKETIGSAHIRTQEDFQRQINKELFSRNITQAYELVYKMATDLGFFRENPLKVHFKIKGLGLGFFFGGLLGFVLGNFVEPKYGLLFWVGVIVLGVLIVNLAPHLSSRTEKGKQEIARWLAFRNYLTLKEPIDYESFALGNFEKYLPYAVVLNCEVAWANRFIEEPFQLPGWFSSARPVAGIRDFAATIFPLADFLGKKLAFVKEPTVD